MGRRWTAADVERHHRRLAGQQVTPVRWQTPPPTYRLVPAVQQTATGWLLTYTGWLPKISNKQVHHKAVWNLMKCGRRTFGELVSWHEQRYATVKVVRVLGPRQKIMDRDKISSTCAGLVDALVPSYLKDDSEDWADITYTNCTTRRSEGPCIEILISYTDNLRRNV